MCKVSLYLAVVSTILLSVSSVRAEEGQLVEIVFHSPALEENLIGDPADRQVIIYLPPSYEASADLRYPVVYLLHGSIGSPTRWTGQGGAFYQSFDIKGAMDNLIAAGTVKEMIFVMPDANNRLGGSWYLSSEAIGDYETYIVRELVEFVDSNYRTLAQRSSRGIGGFSMGGYGSMHLALKYPDVFNVVVSQSGHYDIETSWRDRLEAAARAQPEDWDDYASMSFFAQSGLGIAAAVSANPSRPPLFLDLPFEIVDGEAQLVPEIWALYRAADILTGHLDAYQQLAERLDGIMIVHGSNDNTAPIVQAESLDASMTSLGIIHEYWRHTGGHELMGRSPDRWLQFFSEKLSFVPGPTLVQSRTWGALKIGTQGESSRTTGRDMLR